jgi:predicted nucleic acid-binding protein
MGYINIMKRLYLDNCCLNRPFDDQRQLKIKLETDAKLFIQQELLAGKYELALSYVLDYEIGISPFEERKEKFKQWKDTAKYFCTEEEDILLEAEKLAARKFKIIDALHVSAAKYLHCDYIITTDRKMLNKEVEDVLIVDPIDFLQREVFYED